MADVKLKASGTSQGVLGTELNSLANAANTALGTAYDNTSLLYPWADLLVVLAAQGGARAAGATLSVFMCPAVDGSNYDDANETTAALVGVVPLDAATTARRRTLQRVELLPCLMKFFVRNATGQALAASNNSVTLYPRYDQIV